MSNDFGIKESRFLVYGREIANNKKSIRVYDLVRTDEWEQRNIFELKILRKRFKLGGIEMELLEDPHRCEWYIELLNPGPNCFSSIIWFKSTKCRFGGRRYWFECPTCLKRVGVLYKDGDSFECRKCLDLDYLSHEINYKSLEPAIRYMHKVEKAKLNFRRTYNGKDTRKMKRFYKWKTKARAGFALFGPRYVGLAEELDEMIKG